MLLESGMAVRWYLPTQDVRTDLLDSSDTTTRCPYKGLAHYRSLRLGDRYEKDIAWTYPEPFHDADAVARMICFVDERVEVEVSDDEGAAKRGTSAGMEGT